MGASSPRRTAENAPKRETSRGKLEPERELDALEERWLSRDPAALEQAHARYRSRLEAVATRILGERADAEDVVQRVFVAARSAAYRGSASLSSYLHRAAVNGSVNALRSRRRRTAAEARMREHYELQPPAREASPEAQVLEGEMLAAVARALLKVKPQHRRVLALRILHGLDNTEIAEREGLPVATVGTWLRRGRAELQRGLRPVLREMGRDV